MKAPFIDLIFYTYFVGKHLFLSCSFGGLDTIKRLQKSGPKKKKFNLLKKRKKKKKLKKKREKRFTLHSVFFPPNKSREINNDVEKSKIGINICYLISSSGSSNYSTTASSFQTQNSKFKIQKKKNQKDGFLYGTDTRNSSGAGDNRGTSEVRECPV